MKILELFASIFSLYTMLVVVNIAIKWVAPNSRSRGVRMINMFTEPYLNLIRKLKISRAGYMDLSPLIAVMFLSIINQIIGCIRELQEITLWNVLSVVLIAFWSVFQSILFFILCFAAIRYILMLFSSNKNKPNAFYNICDAFFFPVTSRFASIFFKNTSTNYPLNLVVFIIVLTVFLTAGNFGIKYLNHFILSL